MNHCYCLRFISSQANVIEKKTKHKRRNSKKKSPIIVNMESMEYEQARNLTLLFFFERLIDKNEPRTLHDLSCQFGAPGFTKEMRQIAGGSESGENFISESRLNILQSLQLDTHNRSLLFTFGTVSFKCHTFFSTHSRVIMSLWYQPSNSFA